MSDFKDTKKKVEKSEVDWKEFLSETNETLLNPENPVLQEEERKIKKAKYSCTLAKFASFIEASNTNKNKVIRQRKNKGGGGFPWYHVPKASIKKSLKESSLAPIQVGLNDLNNYEANPDKRSDVLNKKYSIQALTNYQKILLPLEYRQLRKEIFTPKIKSFKFGDIELSVSGIIFFRSRYKTENVIGAMMPNFVLEPLTSLQMKCASHLIMQYIKDHVASEDEIALPEFCLCVDTTSMKFVSAPSGTAVGKVRSALAEANKEFGDRWEVL
jgi:hypothetical protein